MYCLSFTVRPVGTSKQETFSLCMKNIFITKLVENVSFVAAAIGFHYRVLIKYVHDCVFIFLLTAL